MDREELEQLIREGCSVAAIAQRLGASRHTVRRALDRHGLATRRMAGMRDAALARETGKKRIERECPIHGRTAFVYRGSDGGFRCLRCRSQAVAKQRRRVKAALVAEAGGACVICGYARCVAALEFHHLDPREKSFGLALRGVTRSIAALRVEAAKCVLLCSNCHAEVEAGVTALPFPIAADQSGTSERRQLIPG